MFAISDCRFDIQVAVGVTCPRKFKQPLKPLDDLPYDHSFIVKEGEVAKRDEELRTDGMVPGLDHGDDAPLVEPSLFGGLFLHVFAIDGVGHVAGLDEQVRHAAGHRRALVAQARLARAQLPEVLRRLRHQVLVELLTLAYLDLQRDLPAPRVDVQVHRRDVVLLVRRVREVTSSQLQTQSRKHPIIN